MQAHSPVCSTLELHKNKKAQQETFFSCDVVRLGGVHVSGGRGLFGVSESGGVM